MCQFTERAMLWLQSLMRVLYSKVRIASLLLFIMAAVALCCMLAYPFVQNNKQVDMESSHTSNMNQVLFCMVNKCQPDASYYGVTQSSLSSHQRYCMQLAQDVEDGVLPREGFKLPARPEFCTVCPSTCPGYAKKCAPEVCYNLPTVPLPPNALPWPASCIRAATGTTCTAACKPGYKAAAAGSPPSTTCMTGDIQGLNPYQDTWSTPLGACVPARTAISTVHMLFSPAQMSLIFSCMCLLLCYHAWLLAVGLTIARTGAGAALLMSAISSVAAWSFGVAGAAPVLTNCAVLVAYAHMLVLLCPVVCQKVFDRVCASCWCTYAYTATVATAVGRPCAKIIQSAGWECMTLAELYTLHPALIFLCLWADITYQPVSRAASYVWPHISSPAKHYMAIVQHYAESVSNRMFDAFSLADCCGNALSCESDSDGVQVVADAILSGTWDDHPIAGYVVVSLASRSQGKAANKAGKTVGRSSLEAAAASCCTSQQLGGVAGNDKSALQIADADNWFVLPGEDLSEEWSWLQ